MLANESWRKPLTISLSSHIGAIVLIYIISKTQLSLFFGGETTTFVKSAVRVDLVGMPKMSLQELKRLESISHNQGSKEETRAEKDVTNEEVKDSDKDFQEQSKELEKKKEVQKTSEDFLKSLKKISHDKLKKTGETKDSGSGEDKFKSLILEGNRISKGGALTGEATDEQQSALNQYASMILEMVKLHWRLPSYLMNKNLKCRIRIFINADGSLNRAIIHSSSGEADFDNYAQKAVRSAAPFPRPDEEITTKLMKGEIVFGFPIL